MHDEKLHNSYCPPDVRVVVSRNVGWMRTHIGALNIHAEMYSENLVGRDHGEIGIHDQLKLIL
jgi:hypothetical protein